MIRDKHRRERRAAPAAEKTFWSPLTSILIGIPKNLIRISILLVSLSFIYMIYLLNNDKYYGEFLVESADHDFESVTTIHPFFTHLQQSRWVVPGGSSSALSAGTGPVAVPNATLEEVGVRVFYKQNLREGLPLLLVDGCVGWPALENWIDRHYMSSKFGKRLMKPMAITSSRQASQAASEGGPKFVFDVIDARPEQTAVNMGQFLELRDTYKNKIMKDESIASSSGAQPAAERMKMVYLDNVLTPIQVNQQLMRDIEVPSYLSAFLRLEKIGFTLWQAFRRKPHFNRKERLVCLLQGEEKFRMVSMAYKQNMYSGIYEDLSPLESPVNLFETDESLIRRHRLLKPEYVQEAHVKKGNCLFIPSYHWFQSETQPSPEQTGSPESMFLTFEFESSSQMVEELIGALDEGILDDA